MGELEHRQRCLNDRPVAPFHLDSFDHVDPLRRGAVPREGVRLSVMMYHDVARGAQFMDTVRQCHHLVMVLVAQNQVGNPC